MAFIVGIDLGTTTTVLSVLNGQEVTIRPDPLEQGNFTPSVVYYPANGDPVFGETARRVQRAYPDLVVEDAKRSISSEEKFPSGAPNRYAHEVLADILYYRLRDLPGIAATAAQSCIRAVVSVPAYYGDLERKRTREAWDLAVGKIKADGNSGQVQFEFDGLLDEPLAAAIWSSYESADLLTGAPLLVFDLGGGTFDVTIYSASLAEDTGILSVHVFAKDGEQQLGGVDWDRVLAGMWCDHAGVEFEKLSVGEQFELLNKCQDVRVNLGQIPNDVIRQPLNDRSIAFEVTRAAFEERSQHLLKRIAGNLDRAVNRVKAKYELDQSAYRILMVGGATRMPMIRQFVESRFDSTLITYHPSPQEAVSRGACLYAAICNREPIRKQSLQQISSIRVFDIVTRSYGIIGKTRDGKRVMKVVIPRNSFCDGRRYEYQEAQVAEDGKRVQRLTFGAVPNSAQEGDTIEIGPDSPVVIEQHFELRIPAGRTTTASQLIYVTLSPQANGLIEGSASLRDPDDPEREVCQIAVRLVDR